MARVEVLLPTCDRPLAAAMTLAGLAAQSFTDFRLIVADQNRRSSQSQPTLAALARVIAERAAGVEWHHRPARKGIAEQRQFLLERATAPAVLYLDDDVWLEPWVLEALVAALARERCGFIGAFPAGLSFREDVRPAQQHVEFWDGPVRPEPLEPGSPEWERRRHLHRAANLYHATRRHAPSSPRLYKVAWTASCALYDRARLLDVGGFAFWPRLPRYHSGEEVLVQNLLLRRYGGAALMPSGAFHAEEPSTVLNPAGRVDGHALDLLPEMLARAGPPLAEHG